MLPLVTTIVPSAFCPNPVMVVNGTPVNVWLAELAPGTEFPKGVYPTPPSVTVKRVLGVPVRVALFDPSAVSDPANPTKLPCGTVSRVDGEGVLVFAWNTVLPTFNNPNPVVLIPELTNVSPKPTLTLLGLNDIPLSGKSSNFWGNSGL